MKRYADTAMTAVIGFCIFEGEWLSKGQDPFLVPIVFCDVINGRRMARD